MLDGAFIHDVFPEKEVKKKECSVENKTALDMRRQDVCVLGKERKYGLASW